MDLKKRRTIRAIRRLATPTPADKVDERLAKIADLATGKLDPNAVRPRIDGNALVRRMRRARGEDVAEPEEAKAEEKKRTRRGGLDRQERGGHDRSADVNA